STSSTTYAITGEPLWLTPSIPRLTSVNVCRCSTMTLIIGTSFSASRRACRNFSTWRAQPVAALPPATGTLQALTPTLSRLRRRGRKQFVGCACAPFLCPAIWCAERPLRALLRIFPRPLGEGEGEGTALAQPGRDKPS